MLGRRRWLLLAGGALSIALGCTRASRPERVGQPSHPYVILVSFDAFRHDYIDRFHPAAFEEIAARGVRASALIPSFPSKTFPNHYTLVTGLYPGHHGIVANAFYDPARREWYRPGAGQTVRDSTWYGGEPIWVTAERHGVKSGVYFWPGSEAAIQGIRPSYVAAYDGTVPNANRVNSAIAWLRKPAHDRPHLVLLYFSEVDDTTHKYGPNTSHSADVVASVDRTVRQLLDSIAALPFADSVNIVIVSDHGMAQIQPEQVISVTDLLARGGVDTTRMEFGENGPTMSLWFGGDTARVRHARGVLDASMSHAHAYARSETPARWHVRDNPRAGDLLLVADEGYVLQRRGTDRPPSAGVHGYDPAQRDMQGIFLAAGPNVKRIGTIPAFENVHVYPFLVALLALDRGPAVDGNLGALSTALQRRR